MAVFTPLEPTDAERLARGHGLGAVVGIHPVAAGSVNSNFFLDTASGRFFARIYEEQAVDGVVYEWRLLDHLRAHGIPVPERVPGPRPGEIMVAGKPTAVFRLVAGNEICQAGVTVGRARAVGELLARAHRATADFSLRRVGRFERTDLLRRLTEVEGAGRPELVDPVRTLRAVLDDPGLHAWGGASRGVIHGDLFRDNVRFDEADCIVAVIDWESASDGPLSYDLAVAIVAFTYGNRFDPPLVRAMVEGYEAGSGTEIRYLELEPALRYACARFATTRLTDYYLRAGIGDRVYKDYRRFLERLQHVQVGAVRDILDR